LAVFGLQHKGWLLNLTHKLLSWTWNSAL